MLMLESVQHLEGCSRCYRRVTGPARRGGGGCRWSLGEEKNNSSCVAKLLGTLKPTRCAAARGKCLLFGDVRSVLKLPIL